MKSSSLSALTIVVLAIAATEINAKVSGGFTVGDGGFVSEGGVNGCNGGNTRSYGGDQIIVMNGDSPGYGGGWGFGNGGISDAGLEFRHDWGAGNGVGGSGAGNGVGGWGAGNEVGGWGANGVVGTVIRDASPRSGGCSGGCGCGCGCGGNSGGCGTATCSCGGGCGGSGCGCSSCSGSQVGGGSSIISGGRHTISGGHFISSGTTSRGAGWQSVGGDGLGGGNYGGNYGSNYGGNYGGNYGYGRSSSIPANSAGTIEFIDLPRPTNIPRRTGGGSGCGCGSGSSSGRRSEGGSTGGVGGGQSTLAKIGKLIRSVASN